MADDNEKDPDDLDLPLEINEDDEGDFDFDDEDVIDQGPIKFASSPSQRLKAKVLVLLPKAKGGVQSIILKTKAGVGRTVGIVKGGLSALKTMDKKQLLQFSSAFAFVFLILGAIWFIWFGGLFSEPQNQFVRSLYDRADFVKESSEEKGLEAFYDSLRHTQYVFLMDKMTVNLRSQEGGLPMAIFEFFVEGTSREVLLEIKARRLELKDYMQRILEGFTYEEIQTKEGKAKMSVLLKEELNRNLMRGRVRSVFLKTFILKP